MPPLVVTKFSWYNKLGWANFGKHPSFRTFSSVLQYLNAKFIPSLLFYRWFFWSKSDRKIFADKDVRQVQQRNFREAFRQGYKGPMLDLKLYTTDWGFNIANIKSKVYLFYGEDDKNVPLAMGKYYADQIKNSKLKIYPNEGHLISKTHIEEILKSLY